MEGEGKEGDHVESEEPEVTGRMTGFLNRLDELLAEYEQRTEAELRDKELLKRAMTALATPHIADAEGLMHSVSVLRQKLKRSDTIWEIRQKNEALRRAQEDERYFDLKRNLAASRVAVLKAELLEAQVDHELAKHGYEYPQGIQGFKDALDHLRRYDGWQKAYHDLLQRIADVVAPEDETVRADLALDPAEAAQALKNVMAIIKEYEEFERER